MDSRGVAPDGQQKTPSNEVSRSGSDALNSPADEASARVRAEAASRTIRRRLRTLIEALPLAIVTIGRDERVQTWNPAAERLFGWKAEEVLGGSLPIVPEDKRQEFRELIEELQGAQREGLEQSFIRKDGSPVDVSLWTVPLLSDTGEVAGSIGFFADITERKRAQEALATRTRHLEAVRAVSEEITRELNLPVLLRLIIRRAAELVGASSGVIYQWDESAQELVAGAWYDYEDWAGKVRRKLGEGVAGRVAQRRQGLLVNDYQHWPGANPLFRDRSKLTAVLGEPLLYHDQLLGVITLDDQKTERPFTEQDQETLRLFATQAAIAIENARLFQAEQKRVEQLNTVRAVTTEVTRELDLSRLLRLITERSIELLGGGSGAVVLWDEAAQVLVPAAWHGHDDLYGEMRWRLGEGVLGMVAGRREGLIVNEYRTSAYAHPLFLLRTEITATLAEPLLYRDQLLGVVTVDGYGEGRAFTDNDRHLLNLFASQAAIAIENAQLYAASEQRAVELETLRRIEQAITGRLELPAVLEAVVAGAIRILDNPFAQIILWDEASRALRFGAARGPEAERVKNQQFELGRGINGVVAQTREPMILDDYQASPYAVPECFDVVATISVPILFGDRLLGVLHSHTTAAGRRFTPDDLRRLQVLATQAAYAIENARLHEAAVRRSSEIEALLLSSKVTGSSLDLDHVLEAIAQQAAAISATPIVRLFLLEEDAQLLRCRVAVGFPLEEARELVIPVGTSLSGQVAVTGEPLAVADTRGDPRTHYPAHVAKYGVVSYLGLPVKLQDRLLGVLVFNTPTPRTYSTDEITFLSAFAQQAALAIQNARLYETAVQRAQQLKSLNEVARTLTQTLDAERAAREIVAALQLLIPEVAGQLWEKVENPEGLRLVITVGVREPGAAFRHRILLGEGLAGIAAASREVVISEDITQDPRFVNRAWAASEGLASGIGLPLVYGDQLFGALVIFTRARHTFDEQEKDLLKSFAAHAAISIQNARLHTAAIRRGAELEALLRATRSIMAGLDLREILQRIVAEAAAMAGAPHVSLMLVDKPAERLRMAGLVGDPAPSDYQVAIGSGLSGHVAQTGEMLFSRDSANDPRARLAERDRALGLMTYLGLPIKIRDEVLGVLTFETTTPRDYPPDELAYLTSFATQAAIAIENARLHEAVQRHAAELEARVKERTGELQEALRVKAEFLAKMSHELRTPLNFVLGFAELLQQGTGGALTPKQAQFVERIRSGGEQLLELVSDILDLSVMEAGKGGLQLEPVPVSSMVQEVLDLFGIQAKQKRLELRMTVEPELIVVAERRKLVQILSNLVANAVKFTPEGGSVTVTAGRVPAARIADRRLPIADLDRSGSGVQSEIANLQSPLPGDFIEIAVADTGIGLASEDLERIFRGFEQVDGSPTRRHSGAGIGLALVRTLVELHAGKVQAESAGVGKGARFVVHLPLLEAPSPKRVLVVEDQATLLKTLCVFLRDAGYAVEGAGTGTGALVALRDRPPDLAILDIGLPDIDGWEILRRVRADPQTAGLPVLVLTGLGEAQADQAMALGASEYLTKPVSPSALIGIVRELLTGGTRHRGHLAPDPGE